MVVSNLDVGLTSRKSSLRDDLRCAPFTDCMVEASTQRLGKKRKKVGKKRNDDFITIVATRWVIYIRTSVLRLGKICHHSYHLI